MNRPLPKPPRRATIGATRVPVRTSGGRLVGYLDPQTLQIEVRRGGSQARTEYVDLAALLGDRIK